MSGGFEQTEVKEISPFLQKLLDLGISKETAERAVALMNVECLEKMKRWKRNIPKMKEAKP